ncbi:hypothetical protein [Methylobacterium sp. JK268]
MRKARIILPDAGPLFSFAGIDRLDLLVEVGLPIVLTDYIEYEATRSGSVTARRIDAWIGANRPLVTVLPTETGQERIRKEKAGIPDKRKNVGELTIFEAVSNGYMEPGPYVFLFEEERLMRGHTVSFFDEYPVHALTTYALLVGLERARRIPSADAVLADMRGLGQPDLTDEERRQRRRGLRRTLIDRPHRDEQGDDTEWRPPGP